MIGLLAVGLVTYMILWMRSHARGLKRHLEGATAGALATGSTRALVLMAFLAVLREGFETAVFLGYSTSPPSRPAPPSRAASSASASPPASATASTRAASTSTSPGSSA